MVFGEAAGCCSVDSGFVAGVYWVGAEATWWKVSSSAWKWAAATEAGVIGGGPSATSGSRDVRDVLEGLWEGDMRDPPVLERREGARAGVGVKPLDEWIDDMEALRSSVGVEERERDTSLEATRPCGLFGADLTLGEPGEGRLLPLLTDDLKLGTGFGEVVDRESCFSERSSSLSPSLFGETPFARGGCDILPGMNAASAACLDSHVASF